MTARNLRTCVALTTLVACGGKEKPSIKDDAGAGDAAHVDGSTVQGSDVKGALGGVAFELKYSAVKFSVPGDPRNWICVANIPVTYSLCQQSGGPARVMLFGPFTYDQNGTPKWDLAETALYRVGTNALTEFATSGSLDVLAQDSAAGTLSATLSINFGEQPLTTGSVSVP